MAYQKRVYKTGPNEITTKTRLLGGGTRITYTKKGVNRETISKSYNTLNPSKSRTTRTFNQGRGGWINRTSKTTAPNRTSTTPRKSHRSSGGDFSIGGIFLLWILVIGIVSGLALVYIPNSGIFVAGFIGMIAAIVVLWFFFYWILLMGLLFGGIYLYLNWH